MIKISRSAVHRNPCIFLLGRGQRTHIEQAFLFFESFHLFGDQNLASNLIEYDGGSIEMPEFFKDEKFLQLISELEAEHGSRVTVVDVSIESVHDGADLLLEYFSDSLPERALKTVPKSLTSHMLIACEAREGSSKHIFQDTVFSRCHFARLIVSNEFYVSGKGHLSAKFWPVASPRYINTQVPFIMLPASLSAYADRLIR